jgi:hypothetical protein
MHAITLTSERSFLDQSDTTAWPFAPVHFVTIIFQVYQDTWRRQQQTLQPRQVAIKRNKQINHMRPLWLYVDEIADDANAEHLFQQLQLVLLLDLPHLPPLVQTSASEHVQAADGSVQRATMKRPAKVARAAMMSATRAGERPVRQRRSGCPPCPSTRGGNCHAGRLTTRGNGNCPCEKP